jgi:hypothetical protein
VNTPCAISALMSDDEAIAHYIAAYDARNQYPATHWAFARWLDAWPPMWLLHRASEMKRKILPAPPPAE